MYCFVSDVGNYPPQVAAQTFEEKLSQLGIVKAEQVDLSDAEEITIAEPNCAYINITNIASMPTTKVDDMHAFLEVYDCNGNYFKKCVVLNAQGNSSMAFPKKNLSVDFCGNEWDEDNTPSLSIGDWVAQDSYHLKAYYTDFFRGTATVGYKLYDQISKDRGRIWTRAPEGSIKAKDLNLNARCYPDGFPCVVYLNGDFYGLFSWQLKKTRDNMNMNKSTETHIHLDGDLRDSYLWRGVIDWTQFEVRNPKTLYTMDGNKYDGDNPQELIDETSAFYDLATDDEKVKKNKQLSAKVKQHIITLSGYYAHLKELETEGESQSVIKNTFENYFDVPGLIDYVCFHYAINNFDGFAKNWQWFTYDGVKWFVAPYDLDCILGNYWTGNFTLPAEFNTPSTTYSSLTANGPIYWIKNYYWDDIKERYKALRDNGVLSPENIKSIMENWYYRFTETNYCQEWTKWPDSKCISNTVCNENWTSTDNWEGYSLLDYFDSSRTYNIGDKCVLGERIWIATGETTGVQPYSQLGYTDNIIRVLNWIDKRLGFEDEFLCYTIPSESLTSYTLQITNAEWATICVPFAFDIPDGLSVYTVTGAKGDNSALEKEEILTKTEANKPYLIKGIPGFYHLTGYAEEADKDDVETYLHNRLLQGTYLVTLAPEGSYVLQNQAGKLGFYLVQTDELTVPKNRAWLMLPANKARQRALFFNDEKVTAIEPIENHGKEVIERYYDLNGSPLIKVRRGVNIVRNINGGVTKFVLK